MTAIITDAFSALIDGPFYEHAPAAVAALRPLLPTPDEMHAEFCEHLARAISGVELTPLVHGRIRCRAVILTAPGSIEIFERKKLYGRARFPTESVAARASDDIRCIAFALARLYAERIAEQAASLRATREMGAAPVVVRFIGTHVPSLLRRWGDPDALRICVDEYTDTFSAIYCASYTITPAGPEIAPEIVETP